MKKYIYIVIAVALLGLLAFQLLSNKKVVENRLFHYDKAEKVNVHTTTLKLRDVEASHSFAGSFEPNRETKVTADIPGKITALYVEEGSKVSQGQRLIKLDDVMFRLELQALEVQIGGLEADKARFEILNKADAIEGIKLEKTQLGLAEAQIRKKTLLEKISKTVIKAPLSGIVTMKMTELGAFAAPGIPLLQITDISKLKFSVNVPEDQLRVFKVKQSYPVIADAYPELNLNGEVSMVGSKANIGRSFPIQLLVQNTKDFDIKSGMYGRLNFLEKVNEKKIVIPASAIVGSNILSQVYLVKNGKAVLQEVEIGERLKDEIVIESGLKEGDVIVTGGFINLFDGANIANQ